MTTQNTTTAEQNRILENELYTTVSAWVNTFNNLQLEVLEKYTEGQLYEFIRQKPADVEEWYYNQDQETQKELIKEFNEENGNFEDEEEETPSAELEIGQSSIFADWLKENKQDQANEYEQEHGTENYPMWNTCFEFKDSIYNNEEYKEIIENLNMGIIEHEDFNTIIFMRSAGHSFYSSYWIPLYFALFPPLAEKYKGLKYSHL